MPNLLRTSNPALNAKAFQGQVAAGEAMTLQGTVNKTGILLISPGPPPHGRGKNSSPPGLKP